MRRREFIILFGSIAAAWSSKLRAQQPERIRRVALLIALTKSDPASAACVAAFRRGLEELGWQDGHDLRIDIRWAAGDPQKELAYAAEFHRLAPNLAVAHGTPAVFAFKTETPTIPIVFVQVVDPVQEGIISNLSHPGGNITGFMGFEFAIAGKWLQILKKTAPQVTRVAMMFNPNTAPNYRSYVSAAEVAAAPLTVQVVPLPMQESVQIQEKMATIGHDGNYGLIIIPDLFTLGNRDLLVSSAIQHRVPSIFPYRFYALSGGLISYGIDVPDLFYRAASYVDRILKGESPGNLPVQAPTKFQLVVNLKTVKLLGLTLPPDLLAQADEVLE